MKHKLWPCKLKTTLQNYIALFGCRVGLTTCWAPDKVLLQPISTLSPFPLPLPNFQLGSGGREVWVTNICSGGSTAEGLQGCVSPWVSRSLDSIVCGWCHGDLTVLAIFTNEYQLLCSFVALFWFKECLSRPKLMDQKMTAWNMAFDKIQDGGPQEVCSLMAR